MKTIIAAFCDSATAQQAVDYLCMKGGEAGATTTTSDRIEILTFQTGGPDLLGKLASHHVPEDRAHLYAEVMRRGAVLLIVIVSGADAEAVAGELDRLGSLDLEAAEQRWRQEGWSEFDTSAPPYDAPACALELEELKRGNLDVVEEKVVVGKRQVSRGGVRIRSHIVEHPVHETVELREEHIDVQRERVDEPIPASAAECMFQEGEEEFIVSATGEEAVVGKEARIVERVHVGKSVDTRTETIEETERRREVEVEQLEEPHPGKMPPKP